MTKKKPGRKKGGGSMTADIVRMNAEGMTGQEIAKNLGCSGSHVSKILYRHRNEAKSPHKVRDAWAPKTAPSTCQEWVMTPEGLRTCGAEKHKIDGEKMGQCTAHYEAQRPLAGKMRSIG
jgi:predicted transcriptional regulator